LPFPENLENHKKMQVTMVNQSLQVAYNARDQHAAPVTHAGQPGERFGKFAFQNYT